MSDEVIRTTYCPHALRYEDCDECHPPSSLAAPTGYRAGVRVLLLKGHPWHGETGTILIGNAAGGWEIELDNGMRVWSRENKLKAL